MELTFYLKLYLFGLQYRLSQNLMMMQKCSSEIGRSLLLVVVGVSPGVGHS